jgi:hypothetical protein
MKKGLLIGIPIVILIGVGFYVFDDLGGFNPIELEVREISKIELTGIYYKGTPTNEKLGESFRTIENIQKNNPGSTIYTIYYIEPAGKRDTLEVFIGVEASFVMETKGYTKKTVPAGQAIIATIQRHPLVMPSPGSVKTEIETYAVNNALPQPTLFIDRIVGPTEVQVIAPTH